MSRKTSRRSTIGEDLEEEFFQAAENGDEQQLKECLQKGVDVNTRNSKTWRRTALHMAAEGGLVNIAEILIAKGAAVNNKDDWGETPLHIAASQGEFPMVELLVSRGVDVLKTNAEGNTSLELSGTDMMIRRLLKKREQDQRQSELMASTGGVKMTRRIKVFVVGHGNVGKSSLIRSLERIIAWKELLKRDVTKPYAPTPGIEVEIVKIPEVGEASVWDFAGQTQYYVTHAMLLDGRNTIFILNYKSTDPPSKQKQQVEQWLCSIKACNADPNNRPDVVFVATHGDLIADKEKGRRRAEAVLREMQGLFKAHLTIADEVIIMDCRKSHTPGMTQLRHCLRGLHRSLLQKQQDMPKLCAEIVKRVPDWCKTRCSPKGPVMDWAKYKDAVKEFNPAVEESFLYKSTKHLHDLAEVIMVRTSSYDSIIILRPPWLGKDIFGPTLAPENFEERLRRTEDDLVTKDEIYRVFRGKSDPELVITLLQKFQLCHSYDGKDYIFPSLLTQEMPEETWLPTRDPNTLYFGKGWRCRDLTDMFSSDFFPRVQTLLMSRMSYRPTLWKGGAKCFDSNVEALLQMSSDGRTVFICTRSVEGDRKQCKHMMHVLEKLIVQVMQESSPGTDVTQLILSARALKEHREDIIKYAYTLEEVKMAKAESGVVVNHTGGYMEKVVDVMCKTSKGHSRGPSGASIPALSRPSSQSTSSASIRVVGRDNVVVVAGRGASVSVSTSANVSRSSSFHDVTESQEWSGSCSADVSRSGSVHNLVDSQELVDDVFATTSEYERCSDEQWAKQLTESVHRAVVEGDENTVVAAGEGSFVSIGTAGDGQEMEGPENMEVDDCGTGNVINSLDALGIELD